MNTKRGEISYTPIKAKLTLNSTSSALLNSSKMLTFLFSLLAHSFQYFSISWNQFIFSRTVLLRKHNFSSWVCEKHVLIKERIQFFVILSFHGRKIYFILVCIYYLLLVFSSLWLILLIHLIVGCFHIEVHHWFFALHLFVSYSRV